MIDATNEKGNVTKRGVVARLRTIQEEAAPDSDEERDALMRCLVLLEAESNAVTAVKEAQASLDQTVLAHYATLAKTRIKALVVEDKWFASIRTAVEGEVQRLTHGTGKTCIYDSIAIIVRQRNRRNQYSHTSARGARGDRGSAVGCRWLDRRP